MTVSNTSNCSWYLASGQRTDMVKDNYTFFSRQTCSHQIKTSSVMPGRNTNGYRLLPHSWLIEFIHNTCVNTRLSFPDLNSITPDFNFPPAPCRLTTDNGYVGQVQCKTWFNECWSCVAMMRLQTFNRLGTSHSSMIKSFTFWVQCLDTCWTSSSVLRLPTDWQGKEGS